MTLVWPEQLVDRITDGDWVLFLGSGVSAGCANADNEHPPTWAGLLRRLCALIHSDEARAIGEVLIDDRDLISAADHIQHALAGENSLGRYQQTIREAVDGPTGNTYRPSELHQLLLELLPSVVFTTNYDKLFEAASTIRSQAASEFAVYCYNDSGLSDDVRRGDPVLIKLHGSTDRPSEMVLTRADYARVTAAGREAFAVFRALTLTSTVLFLGYSLDDPDIQLVLQATGRDELSPEAHFILAPMPPTPSRVPVFKQSYGVSVLPYELSDNASHIGALEAVRDLVARVDGKRARLTAQPIP